jgi:hypothetical protein
VRRRRGTDLRRHAQRSLPDYMVPSHFVPVETVPLTSNGKVDRRSLPSPFGAHSEKPRVATPPRTESERTIAEVWCDVLGVERVFREDNFFDRGGQSLMSLRAVVQLEHRLRRRVPLALMLTGTLAEIGDWFEAAPTR